MALSHLFLAALGLSFLLSTSAFSQTYQQALAENKTVSPKASTQASDVQIEGALKLNDPYQDIRVRKHQYRFGIKTQSYEAVGAGEIQGGSKYDLAAAGKSPLAGFEMGALWPVGTRFDFALGTQVFYTRQKNNVRTNAGTDIDGELNTTLWSFGTQLGFKVVPALRLFGVLELGQVIYANSSVDEEARFSRQTNFWGQGMGAELNLTETWSVAAKVTSREEITESLAAGVQANNFEIGAIARW